MNVCTAREEQRAELVHQVGDIGVDNLVVKMLQSPGNWKIVNEFMNRIITKKEEDYRRRQGHNPRGRLIDVIPSNQLAVTLIPRTPLGRVSACRGTGLKANPVDISKCSKSKMKSARVERVLGSLM